MKVLRCGVGIRIDCSSMCGNSFIAYSHMKYEVSFIYGASGIN